MVPKVSIIVPIYNVEAFIAECIDSILAQTFTDFELILIDDGSPDGCGRIIDEYARADERVVAVHQLNKGRAASRSAGLDIARGKYVHFVDSDDYVEPDLLEKAVPLMDAGYDMVSFGFEEFADIDGERAHLGTVSLAEREFAFSSDEQLFAFMTGPFRMRAVRWEVWAHLCRRDLIEKWKLRFFEYPGAYIEDMCFSYRYLAHTRKIYRLSDVLYGYRQRVGGAPASNDELKFAQSNQMAHAIHEHFRASDDCMYLADHYEPMFYLLHKAAFQRLHRYQWRRDLSMEQARRTLAESVSDHPAFARTMTRMHNDPIVKESFKKDRGRARQVINRMYIEEVLQIPASKPRVALRKAALGGLRGTYVARRALRGFKSRPKKD